MKKYDFKSAEWKKDFLYARAPHTKANVKYKNDESGVLKNEFNPEINEYDYISILSRERFGAGIELTVACGFVGDGAPCIVFTDDIGEGEDFPEYGLHFEICVHRNGLNVWHIVRFPERVEKPVKSTKILSETWSVDGEGAECTVKFGNKKITALIDGRVLTVQHEDIPEKFRVGITACEGACSFTSLSIKNIENRMKKDGLENEL